jgi:cell division protein FtsB
MNDKDKRIRDLEREVKALSELEGTAVAANVKYRDENAKLRAENNTLRDRNAILESALGDMCDSARAVLAIEPAV